MSWSNPIAAAGKQTVSGELDANDVTVHASVAAGDVDRVKFLHQAIVGSNGGRSVGTETCVAERTGATLEGAALKVVVALPVTCVASVVGVGNSLGEKAILIRDATLELLDPLLHAGELLLVDSILVSGLCDPVRSIRQLLLQGLVVLIRKFQLLCQRCDFGVEQLIVRVERAQLLVDSAEFL